LPRYRILTVTHRLLAAKALRGFGDGFVSLLLPVYLLQLGFSPFQVGLIATTTLLGSGLLTMGVGLYGHRYGQRRLLLFASVLMAGTGAAMASLGSFWPLMVVALVGTLNPSGGDVSMFMPVEHALLAQSAEGKRRTAAFARYSLTGSIANAVGALAAAVPALAANSLGIDTHGAIQGMFVLYAILAIVTGLLYGGLPRASAQRADTHAALGPSRKRVYTLAALFSLDAFGGGFVVQSLVALWLYQRFGLAGSNRLAVLLDGPVDRSLLSRGGADRRAHRPRAHDGLHAPAVQPLPDRHSLLRRALDRHRPAAGEERPLADGRAHPQLLCDGHRPAGGTAGRRERDVCPAQPCRRGEPGARGLPAGTLRLRVAADRRRCGQDRLRPDAAGDVPAGPATGGINPSI
jgi:hypothetical protein